MDKEAALGLYHRIIAFKKAYLEQARNPLTNARPRGQILELQRMIHAARALEAKAPELSIVSAMGRTKRTQQLSHLSDRAPKGFVPTEPSEGAVEIMLSRQLSQEEVKEITKEGLSAAKERAAGRQPSVTPGEKIGVSVLQDTNESRALLTDIDQAFEGGESVLDYAKRTIRTEAARMIKISGKTPTKTVDEIAETLPYPSREQVEHVLAVQSALKKTGTLPVDAYQENLVYRPLAEAMQAFPADMRLVSSRHAETPWVDAGLLTGGGADAALNAQGEATAILVGLERRILNALSPIREAEVIAHSGGLALSEAARCTVVQNIDQTTNGVYKTDEPHIMTMENGVFTIRALTLETLGKALGVLPNTTPKEGAKLPAVPTGTRALVASSFSHPDVV